MWLKAAFPQEQDTQALHRPYQLSPGDDRTLALSLFVSTHLLGTLLRIRSKGNKKKTPAYISGGVYTSVKTFPSPHK